MNKKTKYKFSFRLETYIKFVLIFNLNVRRCSRTYSIMQEIEAGNEDVTALNEELVDRLRLLNYEKDYVSKFIYHNLEVTDLSLLPHSPCLLILQNNLISLKSISCLK